MNPSMQYERMTLLKRDASFDAAASQAALAVEFASEPVIPFQTEGKRTFFLRRHFSDDEDSLVVYRVYVDKGSAAAAENEVGFCRLTRPENGIVTISGAEVKEAYRKKGLATAVYDCIARDMERAGALLWPAGPAEMTDAEFKVWWRRSPALVFYYPHRERLGFERRHEFEALLNEVGSAAAAHRAAPDATAPAASGFRSKLANAFRRFLHKTPQNQG
jgi:predicted GNAT family acetyltransferase